MSSVNEDDAKCSCQILKHFKPHLPSSRKVYIVLLWIILTHGIYNYTIFNLGEILHIGIFMVSRYSIYVIGVIQILVLLFYPVAGIIGEVYWTRYKIMIIGIVLMILSLSVVPPALVGLMFTSDEYEKMSIGGILIAVALIPFQIGLAIFESNIIQFGTNQLLFASSDQLSSYVHWSFWCMYVVPFAVTTVSCFFNVSSATSAPIVELLLVIFALVLMLLPKTRKTLELRKFTQKNPIKLAIGVLKYAIQNKYPVRQSAFTYNDEERYNRINFAKNRYGGPYTTEEVEDVKTLIQIMILFSSMFGFLLNDNTSILIITYGNLQQFKLSSSILESTAQCYVANFMLTFLVIVAGIPIYKLVLTPLFYKFLPNMIKRMGIGLMVTFLSLATQLLISVLLNSAFEELGYANTCGYNLTANGSFSDNTTSSLYNGSSLVVPNTLISQYILIIPQVLNGFSLLLIFLTALEFILAQAPRSMQGLLVGFWYAFQSVNVLLSTFLFTTDAGCSYISYVVRAGLSALSFLLYIVAAHWYKGRIRQESSMIKQNVIIEEYTTRALNQRSLYFQTYNYDLQDFSIVSDKS